MGWKGPHPRPGTTAPCQWCKKPVYSPPSREKKFCSMSCRDAARRAERINEADETARCARCKQRRPFADFVKAGNGLPHSYCKPCSSEWFHERRGTPPEKRKPYVAAFTVTAEEKKARIKAYGIGYRKRNAEKIAMWNRLRRHKERAAGEIPHPYEIGAMLCAQDARCNYCDELLAAYHIDHKTPLSRGGTNDMENLQLLCPTCNMSKGAKTHEEFLSFRRIKADEAALLADVIELLNRDRT